MDERPEMREAGGGVGVICHVVVAVVAVSFAVGQAYDIWTGRENWPWSSYPMYASKKTAEQTALQVWGVRGDRRRNGKLIEFRLRARGFLIPIKRFQKIYGNGQPENRANAAAALVEFGDYYHQERAAGHLKGPPLRSIRLYQLTWTLEVGARNTGSPDRRELVVQTADLKQPPAVVAGPSTEKAARRARAATRAATTTKPATRPATVPATKPAEGSKHQIPSTKSETNSKVQGEMIQTGVVPWGGRD